MVSVDSARPGPLLEPGPELRAEQRARAARQIPLPGFGEVAQRRLAAARVLVIGAGGLGSASVPYLVGAGVGSGERGAIGVVDDDVVELSNLHRQIAHGTADLGRVKTASIADAARVIDPGVRLEQHPFRLTAANALELFADYDLVIDGSDNFPTRYLANDAAELTGIPLVWGAILQYHGQVGVAWHAHGPGYRDLFPAPPAPEDVLSCGTGGVLPGLCGTVGSLLATEAMKIIAGIGEPLIGRALLYDALAARTRELPFGRDPRGRRVTELVDYDAFCAGPDPLPAAVTAQDLAAELRRGGRPRLLDVRSPEERDRLHIPGSAALPLPDLERRGAQRGGALSGIFPERHAEATAEESSDAAPVVVYCERDPRSIRAARILARDGADEIRYLRGGIRALVEVAPELLEGSDA